MAKKSSNEEQHSAQRVIEATKIVTSPAERQAATQTSNQNSVVTSDDEHSKYCCCPFFAKLRRNRKRNSFFRRGNQTHPQINIVVEKFQGPDTQHGGTCLSDQQQTDANAKAERKKQPSTKQTTGLVHYREKQGQSTRDSPRSNHVEEQHSSSKLSKATQKATNNDREELSLPKVPPSVSTDRRENRSSGKSVAESGNLASPQSEKIRQRPLSAKRREFVSKGNIQDEKPSLLLNRNDARKRRKMVLEKEKELKRRMYQNRCNPPSEVQEMRSQREKFNLLIGAERCGDRKDAQTDTKSLITSRKPDGNPFEKRINQDSGSRDVRETQPTTKTKMPISAEEMNKKTSKRGASKTQARENIQGSSQGDTGDQKSKPLRSKRDIQNIHFEGYDGEDEEAEAKTESLPIKKKVLKKRKLLKEALKADSEEEERKIEDRKVKRRRKKRRTIREGSDHFLKPSVWVSTDQERDDAAEEIDVAQNSVTMSSESEEKRMEHQDQKSVSLKICKTIKDKLKAVQNSIDIEEYKRLTEAKKSKSEQEFEKALDEWLIISNEIAAEHYKSVPKTPPPSIFETCWKMIKHLQYLRIKVREEYQLNFQSDNSEFFTPSPLPTTHCRASPSPTANAEESGDLSSPTPPPFELSKRISASCHRRERELKCRRLDEEWDSLRRASNKECEKIEEERELSEFEEISDCDSLRSASCDELKAAYEFLSSPDDVTHLANSMQVRESQFNRRDNIEDDECDSLRSTSCDELKVTCEYSSSPHDFTLTGDSAQFRRNQSYNTDRKYIAPTNRKSEEDNYFYTNRNESVTSHRVYKVGNVYTTLTPLYNLYLEEVKPDYSPQTEREWKEQQLRLEIVETMIMVANDAPRFVRKDTLNRLLCALRAQPFSSA